MLTLCDLVDQYQQLKVKFKALQKYCREMNDKTVKVEDELSSLRVEVV